MSGKNGDIDWEALESELFETAGVEFDRKRARGIRIEADRIVSMILDAGMPRIDIEIAVRSFRSRILEEFPGREELFDALYVGRFRRIWEQFRQGGGELLDDGI